MSDGCYCWNCGSTHPDEIDAVAEIVRLRAVIMDQGIKVGLLLGALSEIDDLAVSHTKGAIGKAQKIARAALAAALNPRKHEGQK